MPEPKKGCRRRISRRLALAAAALAGFGAMQIASVTAEPTNETVLPSNVFAEFLIATTQDSCYAIGDRPDLLREFATKNNWELPSPAMLQRFNHPKYKLINGWTFRAHGRAFAVQQTEDLTDQSRLCSITTKPASERDYDEIKSLWDRTFAIERHADRDTPAAQSHLDAVLRVPSTSLATSIAFHKSTGSVTVLVTAPPLNDSRGRFLVDELEPRS